MRFRYARVAQLVEHDLAKVGVAGSSPVSRFQSKKEDIRPRRIPSFLVALHIKDAPVTRPQIQSPAGLERFEVSAPLRSAQSERPPDVLRRLALSLAIAKNQAPFCFLMRGNKRRDFMLRLIFSRCSSQSSCIFTLRYKRVYQSVQDIIC